MTPDADQSASQASSTEPTEYVGGGEPQFLFAHQGTRMSRGVLVSVLSHVGAVLLVVLMIRLLPQNAVRAVLPERLSEHIVWLSQPGPGGGGGGGGNKRPEPAKKAELPGKEKITVPVVKAPAPVPAPDPPVEPPVNIPAQTLAAAELVAPGVISESPAATASTGVGSGGGAGTGTGSGIGRGQGSGLGEGTGGGTGGGVYQPGNGVTLPQPTYQAKPAYTSRAMQAKLQGTVLLECVVLPDGSVGKVEVKKSLDSNFGLDQEAIKAARQWRFRPGTRMGEPVAVLVSIELTFTLR